MCRLCSEVEVSVPHSEIYLWWPNTNVGYTQQIQYHINSAFCVSFFSACHQPKITQVLMGDTTVMTEFRSAAQLYLKEFRFISLFLQL